VVGLHLHLVRYDQTMSDKFPWLVYIRVPDGEMSVWERRGEWNAFVRAQEMADVLVHQGIKENDIKIVVEGSPEEAALKSSVVRQVNRKRKKTRVSRLH
jgi:hypothetical protein